MQQPNPMMAQQQKNVLGARPQSAVKPVSPYKRWDDLPTLTWEMKWNDGENLACTWDMRNQEAKDRGGRLCTSAEAKEVAKGVPFPGRDAWVATYD